MFSREQLKAAEAPQELIEHFRQNGKSFEYSDENGTVSGWVVGDRILIENITANAGNN